MGNIEKIRVGYANSELFNNPFGEYSQEFGRTMLNFCESHSEVGIELKLVSKIYNSFKYSYPLYTLNIEGIYENIKYCLDDLIEEIDIPRIVYSPKGLLDGFIDNIEEKFLKTRYIDITTKGAFDYIKYLLKNRGYRIYNEEVLKMKSK